ncbi:MAG: hypothetical protein WCL04_03085 [Verrucomicrobiota bacterium]
MKKSAPKPAASSALSKKIAATLAPRTASAKKMPSAPAPKSSPAKPAPKKRVSAKPGLTVITARIDIGFGNALHLRGEGAGLSWHQGLPLTCVADDEWVITLPQSTHPVAFKFLVNDLTWSSGPDYVVAPGDKLVVVPTF